jgi:hypothetical protein
MPSGVSVSGRATGAARALWLATLLIVLPNLAVFGARAVSVAVEGSFDETTGTERVPIYGVWKALNGHSVYERPFEPTYYPALYNGGFYYTYATVARAFGWSGGDVVTGSRFLTACLALAGAWISARLLLTGSASRDRWVYVAAMAVWLSSAGVSWFYLTVRPDIVSLVPAIAALLVCIRAWQSGRILPFAAASLLFFAAWGCKQSTVGTLAGVCLLALVQRRGALLLALVLPFVVCVAVSLAVGGPAYRFNVLVLPSLAGLTPLTVAVPQIARVFLPNPLLVLVPAVFHREWGAALRRIGGGRAPESSAIRVSLRVLTFAAIGSWILCLVALMRDGGYRNSLLEAYIVSSLLAVSLVLHARNAGASLSRRGRTALLAGCIITAAYPIGQLFSGERLGTMHVASPERFEEGRRLAASLARVPKPLFVEESLFAEPWFSTDGKFPAVVLDNYAYLQWRARGHYRDGGVESLILQRRFTALLLSGTLGLREAAERAGYERAPLPPLSNWDVRLYVLPGAGPETH